MVLPKSSFGGIGCAISTTEELNYRIPKVKPKKDFYISERGLTAKQSPTERRIAKILKLRRIKFVQEVSFKHFGFASSPYRFDFYLPTYNVIIEYDGSFHKLEHTKENDLLKNKFCKINKIPIYRYNKKHYAELERHIHLLINKLKKINK